MYQQKKLRIEEHNYGSYRITLNLLHSSLSDLKRNELPIRQLTEEHLYTNLFLRYSKFSIFIHPKIIHYYWYFGREHYIYWKGTFQSLLHNDGVVIPNFFWNWWWFDQYSVCNYDVKDTHNTHVILLGIIVRYKTHNFSLIDFDWAWFWITSCHSNYIPFFISFPMNWRWGAQNPSILIIISFTNYILFSSYI